MHDIVIRGGTIIDGTGKAPLPGTGHRRRAHCGCRRQAGALARIDATGLLVTLAADAHTHYDGQAMWTCCWRLRAGTASPRRYAVIAGRLARYGRSIGRR
jgi:N-acyl-D-aspartate/D-glutamate deacylase